MIFDILDNMPYEFRLRYSQSMVSLAFILFFIGKIEKLSEAVWEITTLSEQCNLSQKKPKPETEKHLRDF